MYRPYYGKTNPPPRYYHPCGQPVDVEEGTVGHSTRLVFVEDDQIVRYCSTCGRPITFDDLIHSNEMPQEPTGWFEDYVDHQDTIASLIPIL